LNNLDFSMVVAMTIVWMVQMPIDQIIDVVAVRNRWVSASRPMHMVGAVARAGMPPGATGRIFAGNLDDMLFHLAVGSGVVQVSIVEVIDMAVVLDSSMATAFAMNVVVVAMMMSHDYSSFLLSSRKIDWDGSAMGATGVTAVCHSIFNQRGDMVVGQRIIDVFALTAG